jgi:hypothetical protein
LYVYIDTWAGKGRWIERKADRSIRREKCGERKLHNQAEITRYSYVL